MNQYELLLNRLKSQGYTFKKGFTNCNLYKDKELLLSYNNYSKYLSFNIDCLDSLIVYDFIQLCIINLLNWNNERNE